MEPKAPPTLFEWAGGAEAFDRLINAFYSQEAAEVFTHPPVPRWGWGEAPPYQG